jgi:epoxyqueuosine reductase
MESRTGHALELAKELGFDAAGVAPLASPPAAHRFEEWLDAGRHAGMSWLERYRERVVQPGRVVPGGRSILVVGMVHSRPPVHLRGGGRLARYAAGRDYHNRMGRLLRRWRGRMAATGIIGRSRVVVDAGPVLERSHAAVAGLGFESKAANLLHPKWGPWYFLGEVLLQEELEPTPATALGSCGTCTACIDACPTQAIRGPGVVDANRCISYHTIENRGTIPQELRPQLGGWVFGCDVCSEVCPWGSRAPDASQALGTHPMVEQASLVSWLATDRARFRTLFSGSPLQRPGRDGLLRNAALALGHHPSDEGRAALLSAMEVDPSPLVRAAAAWSLVHAHGERTRVERALRRENDLSARDDMSQTLSREDWTRSNP